jgi:hypothetical protein
MLRSVYIATFGWVVMDVIEFFLHHSIAVYQLRM